MTQNKDGDEKKAKFIVRRARFHNKHGFIKLGVPVSFEVENQNMWYGDLTGVLAYDEETKEYVIDTERSGRLKTSGYLSVYWNTIKPLDSHIGRGEND